MDLREVSYQPLLLTFNTHSLSAHALQLPSYQGLCRVGLM